MKTLEVLIMILVNTLPALLTTSTPGSPLTEHDPPTLGLPAVIGIVAGAGLACMILTIAMISLLFKSFTTTPMDTSAVQGLGRTGGRWATRREQPTLENGV